MLFYATLPPSRSCPSRKVTFYPPTITQASPVDGILEIVRGRKTTRYAVSEGLVARGYGSGRCFQLLKADGTAYWVYLATDRQMSTCDCAGCSYGASEKADRRHGNRFHSGPCCHIDALASVIAGGFLPDPRAGDPYRDVGATETEDQNEPEPEDDVNPYEVTHEGGRWLVRSADGRTLAECPDAGTAQETAAELYDSLRRARGEVDDQTEPTY